jgi:hypothetical protein
MPTPSQIEAAKRNAEQDPYFTVHEVVECVSEGEEGFGEEDLPEAQRSQNSVGNSHKKISQETFNQAVLDNMEMFDLDVESSIKQTIEEFKIQGVSLEGINFDINID